MAILWLLIYTLGFLLIIVLTQDIHIFPGAVFSLFKNGTRDPKSLPRGVESVFIRTVDGKRLEVWRLGPAENTTPLPFIGLAFHGNGGTLEDSFALQLWFHHLGITSYSFDYRGYGKSTGWPSEKGLEKDSDSFWQYVMDREQVSPEAIIVLGFSVGSAPATRIAALHQPHTLLLISPFTDLQSAIRSQKLLGVLAPFTWHKFPTIDYLGELKTTNLLLACSTLDTLIPPEHSERLRLAYRGSGSCSSIVSATAGHNMVFYTLREALGQRLIDTLQGR